MAKTAAIERRIGGKPAEEVDPDELPDWRKAVYNVAGLSNEWDAGPKAIELAERLLYGEPLCHISMQDDELVLESILGGDPKPLTVDLARRYIQDRIAKVKR